MANNANNKIIYPELSYKIVGAAFNIFNELGYGLSEKLYQIAMGKELHDLGLNFRREVYAPLNYKGEKLVKGYADFVVEDKILLELKVVSKLGYVHSKQVLNYLKTTGTKLGILLYFTKDGVKYRRVINSDIRII